MARLPRLSTIVEYPRGRLLQPTADPSGSGNFPSTGDAIVPVPRIVSQRVDMPRPPPTLRQTSDLGSPSNTIYSQWPRPPPISSQRPSAQKQPPDQASTDGRNTSLESEFDPYADYTLVSEQLNGNDGPFASNDNTAVNLQRQAVDVSAISFPDHELTLTDIPQLLADEKGPGSGEKSHVSSTGGHPPFVAALTPLHSMIVKHTALLAFLRSPLLGQKEMPAAELLGLVEVKKERFWNKIIKGARQKKGKSNVRVYILL